MPLSLNDILLGNRERRATQCRKILVTLMRMEKSPGVMLQSMLTLLLVGTQKSMCIASLFNPIMKLCNQYEYEKAIANNEKNKMEFFTMLLSQRE